MADFSNITQRDGFAQQYAPDELINLFGEYVQYMNTTGLIWVYELVKYKGKNELVQLPKRAPLTVKGFCLHIRMSHVMFVNYMNPLSTSYKDYNEVATYINDFCAVDVFNGAAVGIYNGNLAATLIKKDFGLIEAEDNQQRIVDVIKHEISFIDYEDVTHTAIEPPMDNVDIRPPAAGMYDNRENYSSRQDNMKEYEERNGQKLQED